MNSFQFKSSRLKKSYPSWISFKDKTDDSGKKIFNLKDIDLTMLPNQITGVVGENGNGKTTLLRMIAGELSHTNGEISFWEDAFKFSDWQPVKEQLAYIPQRIPRWFGVLKDNLHLTASIHGFHGRENIDRVESLLEQLGLTAFANHRWSEISTGYRLRFQLAKVLLGKPRLLVLDEPIANLDINAQEKFLNDLRYFVDNSEEGLAVILSSQQLHEIENISDQIIFLKRGESLYTGAVEDFGRARDENTFELKTDLELDALKGLFSFGELNSVSERANQIIIETVLEIDSKEILSRLLNSGATVLYFRDISKSTRKLFGTK